MIGQVVGNCKITEKIGVGGFGTVYKGIQLSLNREVAVKVLHPQFTEVAGFVDRFRAEAKILATLSHNNIVQVYDIVEQDKAYFIIMEYVRGQTMKDILAGQKHLPREQAVKAALDVARALAYTHRKNIIHRDIKPANIIFTEDGTVKVTDFGIAKVLTEADQSFTRVGSLSYSSPEQISGEVIDARTDIYALGITLYYMLIGELPSTSAEVVSLRSINSSIPAELEKIVTKAIQKKKEDRYANMELFLNALERVSTRLTQADKPDSAPDLSREKTRLMEKDTPPGKPAGKFSLILNKPARLYAGLAAVIVVIILIGIQAKQPPKQPSLQNPKEMALDTALVKDKEPSATAVSEPVPGEKPVLSEKNRELSEQFYRQGLKHTSSEEWIEAVKDFEEAITYNNQNSLAYYELGYAYSHLSGRSYEAQTHIKKAIELNPQNVLYRYSLGLIYLNDGKKTEAIQTWEKAKEIDPQNATIEAVLKKYKK